MKVRLAVLKKNIINCFNWEWARSRFVYVYQHESHFPLPPGLTDFWNMDRTSFVVAFKCHLWMAFVNLYIHIRACMSAHNFILCKLIAINVTAMTFIMFICTSANRNRKLRWLLTFLWFYWDLWTLHVQ